MIVKIDGNKCIVTKEKNDPKFYSSNWSLPESTFLYHVQQELIKQGYDVIKKRMWKDGHLVDDTQQYIRSRKVDDNGFMIFNNNYAMLDAGLDFNTMGEFVLSVVYMKE